ncbi:hypothetical protein OUZ56_018764 [Daphnia magna]|uniref:Uncharacterized protein n=1 Tax=Daphnia magna TaxID=35525 RepID=A0ABQ9Z9Q1_9CRUS|nr:hypothetical protein OUZ56_018764 [Daphnia magna]
MQHPKLVYTSNNFVLKDSSEEKWTRNKHGEIRKSAFTNREGEHQCEFEHLCHGPTLEVPELSSARPVLGCSSAISADKFWGTR